MDTVTLSRRYLGWREPARCWGPVDLWFIYLTVRLTPAINLVPCSGSLFRHIRPAADHFRLSILNETDAPA
jgi:hypothetical protein